MPKNKKIKKSKKHHTSKKNVAKNSKKRKGSLATTKKKKNVGQKQAISSSPINNIKKSPQKKKVVVKKSFTVAKSHNTSLRTSFLILALFLCILAISVIVLILFSQFFRKDNQATPPVVHQLSKISDETTFTTIKNSLLQHTSKSKNSLSVCSNSKFFNTTPQTIAYAHNKFLIILKRGKIFITNTATNRFISYTEISPYPTKEDNAITYNNVFVKDDTIIVTGYRSATKALEITTFSINTYGKVIRKEAYSLPSSDCNFASNLTDDKLNFYTSRTLDSETTLEDIKTLGQWSTKLNQFIKITPKNNNVFYDNATLLSSPLIHTITTCTLTAGILTNCEQCHLLDNDSKGQYLSRDNLYLWTTQSPLPEKILRNAPSSKLYQINLSEPIINMVQVEGIPISKNSVVLNGDELSAIIYQNDQRPPVWQTNFTKNKIAYFKLNIDDFSSNGGFVNSPDNYLLSSALADDVLSETKELVATYPKMIVLDKLTSTISIYAQSITSISIDGSILGFKLLPNQKILLVNKKNSSIVAQFIDITSNTLSSPTVLGDNDHESPTIEIASLTVADKQLVSIGLINDTLEKGSLHLLETSTSNPSQIFQSTFTKSYQRLTDGCQNDCQESWKNKVSYFVPEFLSSKNTPNYLYSIAGSKLSKFTLDNDGKVRLLKTIDYSYKPAPPKPRRPRARIPGGAKIVNGKYVCKKKHDYVGKSKKNNKGYLHLDLECCLDPDEYPNPWCTYRPGELSVTNLRYKDYHGNVKKKKH